jgi:hypothetical protein
VAADSAEKRESGDEQALGTKTTQEPARKRRRDGAQVTLLKSEQMSSDKTLAVGKTVVFARSLCGFSRNIMDP